MKKKTFIVQLLDSKKPNKNSFTQVEDALFYSNDTDASLVFIPHEDTFNFEMAKVVMYNRSDESLVERDMVVTTENGRKVASYELPEEIIAHWGEWVAQPVFTSIGEIYSGAIVSFSVLRYLMHNRPAKLTEIIQLTEFIQQSQAIVDGMAQSESQRVLEEQTRQSAETVRVQAESQRVSWFNTTKPEVDEAITKADQSEINSSQALTNSQNALGVANGINAKATSALSLAESADTVSRNVRAEFDQILIDGGAGVVVEVSEARTDANGQSNATLKARLDKEYNEIATQLSQATKSGIDLVEWGIKNDGTNATATTAGLNNALQSASENGQKEAYLQAGTYLIDSVNSGVIIPSGMTFIMSPETILKVKPNNSASYATISLSETQNDIRIIGGQIWGDRKEHDYTGDPTHEGGHGILLNGCSNVLIDSVKIKDCTGDSIMVNSQASRIHINNCVLDSARRSNISLNGCDHVVVENSQILNAGINDGIKDGVSPKSGIDIGTSAKIAIRNNKFEGNVNSSVENSNGQEVIIDSNFSDNSLSYGTVISNNILKRTDNTQDGIKSNGVSTVVGNTIQGFEVGVSISGENVTVSGNTINDVVTGMSFSEADKISVIGNSIKQVTDKAFNITTLNNLITIQNNVVDEYGEGVLAESGNIIVKGNIFNLPVLSPNADCMNIKSNVKAVIVGNTINHLGSNVVLVDGGDNTGTISMIKNDITCYYTAFRLSVPAKYEVMGNLIKSTLPSATFSGLFYAVQLGDDVSGAEIVDNTYKSLTEFPYQKVINTAKGTDSKIINNVTLNGGAINSNATDLVQGNTLFT